MTGRCNTPPTILLRRQGRPTAAQVADRPVTAVTGVSEGLPPRRVKTERPAQWLARRRLPPNAEMPSGCGPTAAKCRLVRIGQVLMAVGVVVGVGHRLVHIGTIGGQPSGTTDLLAGFPAAAVVLVAGAVPAGQ